MFNRKNHIKKRENNQVYTESSIVSTYFEENQKFLYVQHKALLIVIMTDTQKNLSNFTLKYA